MAGASHKDVETHRQTRAGAHVGTGTVSKGSARGTSWLTLASTMLSSISLSRLAAASNSGFSLCSSKPALVHHAICKQRHCCE